MMQMHIDCSVSYTAPPELKLTHRRKPHTEHAHTIRARHSTVYISPLSPSVSRFDMRAPTCGIIMARRAQQQAGEPARSLPCTRPSRLTSRLRPLCSTPLECSAIMRVFSHPPIHTRLPRPWYV